MDLEFFLVCQDIAIDRESNRMSLFNIVDSIRLGGEGIPAPLFVAIACLKVDVQDYGPHTATFKVIADGEESQSTTMPFEASRARQRCVVRMVGLPKASREVAIEFFVNGQEDRTRAHHSIIVEQPESAPRPFPEHPGGDHEQPLEGEQQPGQE